MELQEFVAQSGEVVNELSRAIENRQIGLKEVEERILQFVNRIGDLMVQEVLEGINEPFTENRVWVQGQEAVFDQVRTLRFRNRFGGTTERKRRCYKYLHRNRLLLFAFQGLENEVGSDYNLFPSVAFLFWYSFFVVNELYHRERLFSSLYEK